MNETHEPSGPQQRVESPEHFELRGRPRPVVRFRRGLFVGLAGALAASLAAFSWIALRPPTFHRNVGDGDFEEPSPPPPPEALAGAPKDYGEVPRLGPPLPGDLGRPIVEHERNLGRQSPADRLDGRSQSLESRGDEQAREADAAARSSPVLVELGQGEGHGAASPVPSPEREEVLPLGGETGASAIGNAGQEQKIAFTRSGDGDLVPFRLRPSPSRFTLAAGTIIPASLITGIDSDLPGMVMAQVTRAVRDSASGTMTLVPQGARLIGRYDSMVSFGQRRALLVWSRIMFPDGSSIDLDKIPATDVSGFAGLRGSVDTHMGQILKGIGLATVLGVGSELSLGSSRGDVVRAVREAAQQNGANVGQQMIGRDLSVQPTIRIRPGWPVRAILNKDLVLAPWIE